MHRVGRTQKSPGKSGCSINSWFLRRVRLPVAFYGFSMWPPLSSPATRSRLPLHTGAPRLQSISQSWKHLVAHPSWTHQPTAREAQCQWGHTEHKQSRPFSCSSANPFPSPLHIPPSCGRWNWVPAGRGCTHFTALLPAPLLHPPWPTKGLFLQKKKCVIDIHNGPGYPVKVLS